MTAVSDAGERSSFAWSPKPYESAKAYMVQNFRVAYNFIASDLPPGIVSDGIMFSYETGFMVNAGREFGYGAGLWLALEDLRSRVGAGARVRRWLSRTSALDFSAGAIVGQLEDVAQNPVRDFGLFATGTYSYHENLLFTLHFENVKYLEKVPELVRIPPSVPYGERKSYLYAGLGTGGDYGLAVAGTGLVILSLVVALTVDISISGS